MKKRLMTSIIIVLAIGVCYFAYQSYKKTNVSNMVMVGNLVYTLTDEPSSEKEIIAKLGNVKEKIGASEVPEKNFESNDLPKGTSLYSRKGGEDFPHSIIYEKDGKLFVGIETDPSQS